MEVVNNVEVNYLVVLMSHVVMDLSVFLWIPFLSMGIVKQNLYLINTL
ncbi:hypothetical protein [Elizabethkingia miricola]